jgi:hypothetical protein
MTATPRRMTAQDIDRIKTWLLTAVMEPAVREGFGLLLREGERARTTEADLRTKLEEVEASQHAMVYCEELD